ncbi:MaoC family dehydratase N-terminal domain-containing protein [Thermodesulfobacteriota bacterium]
MAPDRKTLIGKTFPPIKCVIDEDDLNTYLRVTGEEHPAYYHDADAQEAGYKHRVIPPSYGPFLALLFRSFDWGKDFLLDMRTGTVVFGEQELEYLRPICFGETLYVQGTVSDVFEKQGKKLFDVIVMNLTGKDEKGNTAFQGALDYIIFK